MSKDIYSDVNIEEIKSKIDLNRLSRDYFKEPLRITKNGIGSECLTKEELEYLYIELNLTRKQIGSFLHCNVKKVAKMIEILDISKSKELRILSSQEILKQKYGVKSPFSLKEVQDKSKKTCEDRYGDENYHNVNKMKQTKLEKYGNESFVNPKKAQETNLQKYGVKCVLQANEIKEKTRKTNIHKFGVDVPMKSKIVQEKAKNTVRNKFGVDYVSQLQENIDKMKQTNLEIYGSECSLHGNTKKGLEVRNKCVSSIRNKFGVDVSMKSKMVQKKVKNTMNERYGVDSYFIADDFQQKSYLTKKKNNSFGKSKIEDKIYEILLTKFPNTIHHPEPNEKYPFQCDFYIPELDLYIEYQGYKSHGKEPYNPDNPEHIVLVEEYKKKAEEINFKGEKKIQYLTYINTWTQRDPLKRTVANKNKLNWIEFFNMEQFMEWFNKQ